MNVTAMPAQVLRNLLNQLSDSTGDYYLLYDQHTRLFYFSDNIHEMFARLSEDMTSCSAKAWRSIVYQPDLHRVKAVSRNVVSGRTPTYNFNYRIYNRYGQPIWINSRGKSYVDPQTGSQYILGCISRHRTFNRDDKAHDTALTKELKRVYREGRDGFLIVVGVDGLRRLNLKHGREFGDAVIRALADSMLAAPFNVETVYRVNGDCFCVLLFDVEESQVREFFETVQSELREQCTVSGGAVSLQRYQVPEGAVLLQYAECALESAKKEGPSRLNFFSPGDYEGKLHAMELQEELEDAVRADFDGFSLQYQAQVRSESLELFGAEALLRFCSPRRGMISPEEFVPILEASGLIRPVGLWCLRTALAQCRVWRETRPDFHMSVNMSYEQLRRPEIQAQVLHILKDSGLPGNALTIEVTESMELQDYPQLNTIFSAWKKAGIQISVDDFGTGYSSLSYLKYMAVDEVKIDRCFITGIQHSAYNLRLVSNMIELADSCQMRVCCEGVETMEELAVLERLRPTTYQGFFFAKPSLPEAFESQNFDWQAYMQPSDGQLEALSSRNRLLKKVSELEHSILEVTEDILALSDVDTHEIYYLNPAGQRIFGVRDYHGRKCYKVFQGLDTPCDFCPNAILRQDSFHVWENWNEYCGRHFMIKDKLLYLDGRKLRMEVGTDITKNECVSQQTRERLQFAQTIAGYVEILRSHRDYGQAVQQVLASMGEFYQADRAYLFERNPHQTDQWDNTYEWCAPRIEPQKDKLQGVPPAAVQRWMDIFSRNESVILYNLEPIKKEAPVEYEILQQQGIQRLISVPMVVEDRIVGFIGVDNPHYSLEDDSQARILAAFLASRYVLETKNKSTFQ